MAVAAEGTLRSTRSPLDFAQALGGPLKGRAQPVRAECLTGYFPGAFALGDQAARVNWVRGIPPFRQGDGLLPFLQRLSTTGMG